MRARWDELGIRQSVRFVPAGRRGEGLDAVDFVATDRGRAGESATMCGVELRLV